MSRKKFTNGRFWKFGSENWERVGKENEFGRRLEIKRKCSDWKILRFLKGNLKGEKGLDGGMRVLIMID